MYLFSFLFLLLLLSTVFRRYSSSEFIPSLHAFDVQVTTSIKGLMAVAIVLHHVEAHIFIGKYPIYTQLANWGLWIVSMFFFITGYGLQFSIENKGKNYLVGFFRKRLAKILTPLILATIIYILIIVLINNELCETGGG